MSPLVIDASVAIKWVIEEEGTTDALALRGRFRLIGPELLAAECANVLWKKVQRKELSAEEALLAARLLEGAEIEFVAARALTAAATKLAIALNHPAYDCVYLALAVTSGCRFVTADQEFAAKVRRARDAELAGRVALLGE